MPAVVEYESVCQASKLSPSGQDTDRCSPQLFICYRHFVKQRAAPCSSVSETETIAKKSSLQLDLKRTCGFFYLIVIRSKIIVLFCLFSWNCCGKNVYSTGSLGISQQWEELLPWFKTTWINVLYKKWNNDIVWCERCCKKWGITDTVFPSL